MHKVWLVPTLLLGLGGSATADPPAAWTLGVQFPWDVAHADGNTSVGVFGVGLDVARTLTDRWSAGVAAEGSFLMNIQPDAPIGHEVGPAVRLRGGVEARYIFHTGTSFVVPRCGPAFEVPARAWLGGRAGYETLDEGTTHGRFAELAIGWERIVGPVTVGPYLAVGVEDEPAAAYPVAAPDPFAPQPAVIATPPSDPVISPYVTLGMRIGGA